jgi:hypothetical protein
MSIVRGLTVGSMGGRRNATLKIKSLSTNGSRRENLESSQPKMKVKKGKSRQTANRHLGPEFQLPAGTCPVVYLVFIHVLLSYPATVGIQFVELPGAFMMH